jgi:hypothetical protein
MTTKTAAMVMLMALTVAMTACSKESPTAPSAAPIPNYAGTWTGTYTITGCTQQGGMALVNICADMGSSMPYQFNFQQSGSSVTGSFMMGSINFPSTGGTVASDGSLPLQATTIRNGVTIIVNWALRNAGGPNPVITGTVTSAWTSTTLSGQTNIAGTMASSIRGGAASATSLSSATSAVTSEPVTPELLRLMFAGKR